MTILKRWFLALFAALLIPAIASAAAVDCYLKLEGVKGESKVAHCVNGACAFDGLAVGTYRVSVCDAHGKVIASNLAGEYSVKSPRDAASGQATGKRMHKPFTITMELGKTSMNEIAIDEAGSGIAIMCSPKMPPVPASSTPPAKSK